MKTSSIIAAAASALAMLSACSPGETDNQTVSAPVEQAAAGNTIAMTNDPNNPYGPAEMQMHERMMAAQGANASETWVRKMIEHHRGAIDMSDLLVNQAGEQSVVEKARKTAEDQRNEIADLERLLQAGGIGAGTTGNADPYAASEKAMHDRMMGAVGTNPSETWIRKMIEHHRGAIEMSNILIRQGGDPKVVEKARMTVEKQQKEVGELERMLGGGDAAAATAAAAAPASAPASKAGTRPTPPATKKVAAPAAAAKNAPKTAAEAETKSATTAAPQTAAKESGCAPEHRALGHC